MDAQLDVSITPAVAHGQLDVQFHINYASSDRAHPTKQIECDPAEDSQFYGNPLADELLYQAQPTPVVPSREEELLKLVSALENQVDALSQ
jgi:hypothetical protein